MVNYYYALSPSISFSPSPHHPAGIDYVSETVSYPFPPTDQALLNDTYNLTVPDRLRQSLPVSLPFCANISIIDDDIVENGSSKVLQLNISHISSMVTFVPPLTAMVSIEDDDSELHIKTTTQVL